MKRVTVVCGSAGRGGVTESMCQCAAEELRRRGFLVHLAFPSEMDIRHCTGCDRCADGVCAIDDDMAEVFSMFAESDLLILSSPLHFSGPSSLIKTVMDRFQAYWHRKDMPHPDGMAAMLCAGSDRPDFSHTVSIMRAFSITTGMRWMGHLEFPGTDSRGDEGVREAVHSFIDRIAEDAGAR